MSPAKEYSNPPVTDTKEIEIDLTALARASTASVKMWLPISPGEMVVYLQTRITFT